MVNELGYFTLPVGDLARAKEFYGALFGWTFEDKGHVANTKLPLGLAGGAPGKCPNAYFKVEDIDLYSNRVTNLGGKVLDELNSASGRIVVCADDQGTVFSIWRTAPGFE